MKLSLNVHICPVVLLGYERVGGGGVKLSLNVHIYPLFCWGVRGWGCETVPQRTHLPVVLLGCEGVGVKLSLNVHICPSFCWGVR